MEGGYFRPEFSGDFRVDASGLTGTDVDLEGVTDIATEDDVPYGAAALSLGGFTLTLSGWYSSLNGDTTLTVPLDFNGQTFVVNERVITDLELVNGAATLDYSLSPFELIYLAVGAGVDVFDVELRIQQPTVGIDETFDQIIPIPVLSVSGEFNPFDFLGAFVSAKGFYGRSEWLGIDDAVQGEALFLDLLAGVRASWEFLTASVGYKWILIDLGLEEASADLEFRGLFATVGVEF